VRSRPGSSRRASLFKTTKLPSGSQWLHEVKHDGLRIIARKSGARVRITEAGRRALTQTQNFRMTKFPKIGLDNASQYLNDVSLAVLRSVQANAD
jgi:ATP-dependent DNA ligase